MTVRVLPADSTTSSDTTYGSYGEQPPILIVIGHTTIPFAADSSLAELQPALPKPVLLPPEHPDDNMHGNNRYCYAFPGGFLTFEDADGEIWKASLLRAAPVKTRSCPKIDIIPTIRFGDHVISIDISPFAITEQSFAGFRHVEHTAHMLQHDWWHISHVSDGRAWCGQHGIDINFDLKDSLLTWISVESGEEGWPARRVEGSDGSPDRLWTCRSE